MENRPVGRKKNVTEGGSGVNKRGDGLGTGPVGSSTGYSSSNGPSGGGSSGPQRSGGRSPLFMIIVIAILLLGGGGGIGSLLGGGGSSYSDTETAQQYTGTQTQQTTTTTTSGSSAGSQLGSAGGSLLGSLLGGYSPYGSEGLSSASWSSESNTGKLDTTVAEGARAKRTVIKGNGEDTVTIMVYMCGADLESRSGMATKDIQEMLRADLGDKINLIIYTGGAKSWQNNVVSSSTNQIYQVKNGQLVLLKDNLGSVPMTKPDTLSDFIKWTAQNFPADRTDLIFWDHGGGSAGGYGYDEKFATAGAMSLAGINTALKDGGVTFDFVGFDTCLMATVENALLVSNYADYLVASEETEPGVGWYYTDWLTALGRNTSMETLEIGKNIIDSFTNACAQSCAGQKTTLSLIDLAELSQTVPSELADFSKDTSEKIQNNQYAAVSTARSSTREFAASSRIDQVDLVDFAIRMDTTESKELADALKSAIKYNRTSSNMTNAYGLSIYFPSKKLGKVDSMVDTYEAIGMDDDYAKCIQQFASMNVAGQVASGGSQTASPMGSLFGDYTGSEGSAGGSSAELIGQLLNTFLSSDFSSISGLNASNTSFLGKGLDVDTAAKYIADNQFDASALMWAKNEDGQYAITLTEEQWKQVSNLTLNMFYDDGEGYVDLGLDNTFEYDEAGNLLAPTDRTWLAIDGQVVAYYVIDVQAEDDSYAITGRVPCFINGNRANLILVFDSENEDGYVAGANYDYKDGETETVAKNVTELEIGDKIDFICDYYDYNRNYKDSYYLGDPMTLDKEMKLLTISNVSVGDGPVLTAYCFTDTYDQSYWTPFLKN
ncbi:clostripain-related cysteine peptidase [Butyrivibrio sp. AE3009]|uniref:clostripain-related cysteine peptidase n=1 Tax=Butyrivibrio sp. AE3009 TaxID=1280666 RepID=UPI0003B56B1B|nr:clostripain-related cysteine peptidase [Butyrivibrio sp. AE3009]